MPVANTIKEARTKKNICQEELAEAIQCSPKTISRYETGERCPSLELALRLAKYLELSMDALFKLDDEK